MAKQSDAAADAAEPPKKKARWLIPAVSGLVLLAGGGGAAWYFLAHKSAERAPVAKPAAPPIFVTLEPYVVNLAGDVDHYVQVGIDLKVADAHVGDKIKEHLPEIRNGILLLLSSKSAAELATLEGKNTLRLQIRDTANRHLGVPVSTAPAVPVAAEPGAAVAAEHAPAGASQAAPAEGVLDVLLTSFVIQ